MERGAAEELVRRQKRRELDARRGKCRIRIGGHLERWCRLKEQLGFSLHSQLAQFLLDRYSAHGSTWSSEAERLQRLVVLSHRHGQECGLVPDVQLPTSGGAAPLVWQCAAGHRFSWGGDAGGDSGGDSGDSGRRRRRRRDAVGTNEDGEEGTAGAPKGDEEMGDGGGSGGAAPQAPPDPDPAPATSDSAVPGDEVDEPREEEEDEDSDLAYGDDARDENYHPSSDSPSAPQRRQNRPRTCRKPIKEEPPLPGSVPLEEKSGRASCRRPSDADTAQIGPKRIRKAAKREILLCDFEGCGKIFSNRQYLNHHRKYQHVQQKTFRCSEPSCGKSFDFKKHLKEHEKLHSDKRDYICEFCARSFRTSSNLIIHRRIHTGEKPLQCEICGFTCRQKASLNWHMRKHDADSSFRFPCDVCGKRFEKRDNVAAHKSKSHPGHGIRQIQRGIPEPEKPEKPGSPQSHREGRAGS